MRSGYQKNTITHTVAALALACAAPAAMAQSAAQPGSEGGVSVHVGVGEKYNRATINYETAPVWGTEFGGNWGRLDLTGEFGVSYWKAHSGKHPNNAWQLSAIPFLRWWVTDRFYLEGGIGATVFNKTQFADKTISSAFQFGDHIGLGYQLTPNSRLGLRYSHFSNAGIKRPNPGLDVTQLTYTYLF